MSFQLMLEHYVVRIIESVEQMVEGLLDQEIFSPVTVDTELIEVVIEEV